MGIRIENSSERMTVWLSGELDHHSARQLREQIDAAVEKAGPKHLCLNFSEVGFMDSSGVGLIMGRYRLIKLYGGTLEVTGASERVTKVMTLAGLDRLDILTNGENAGISR